MNNIRLARSGDLERLAEILVFNYRTNFYPIFKNDQFYFEEFTVSKQAVQFLNILDSIWVYDDGVVKGFVQVQNREVKKLFVEPVLQGKGIGEKLLEFAVSENSADFLWALEKNERAIRFYERYGFSATGEKKFEEGTKEYLVCMKHQRS